MTADSPASQPETTGGQAAADLWAWLSKWIDERGGVHGYVVHHHKDNLRTLAPDTWTQSACIFGCLNLFKLTKRNEWFERATKLCDYLVSSYIPALNVFANSNHEHKPLGKPELISNALPSYALLEGCRVRKNLGLDYSRYLGVAEDNITKYLLLGWDEKIGAIASLDQSPGHFILNMNGISAMALASYSAVTGDGNVVNKYATRICDFIQRNQTKVGEGKGDYPYRAGIKYSITLYSLLTAYALCEVASITGDKTHLEGARDAYSQLESFFSPQIGLVSHSPTSAPPYWLPDTFLLHSLAARLAKARLGTIRTHPVGDLLRMQYQSGGFPLSVGFADGFDRSLLPSRMGIRRWRDILPTPNWNAWMFWHLTEALGVSTSIPRPAVSFPHVLTSDKEEWDGPFEITDEGPRVVFRDAEGRQVAIFVKTQDSPLLCQVQERNEGFRLKKMLDRYPSLAKKAITRGSGLFPNRRTQR